MRANDAMLKCQNVNTENWFVKLIVMTSMVGFLTMNLQDSIYLLQNMRKCVNSRNSTFDTAKTKPKQKSKIATTQAGRTFDDYSRNGTNRYSLQCFTYTVDDGWKERC